MSSYDFIIDGIRFSYSAISTYESCPYAYKLTYLDSLPRQTNFYAEYGSFIHTCMEKFFKGELEAFELSQFYEDNYKLIVKTPAPPSPYFIDDKYKREGKEFFDNFFFPLWEYDVIFVEDAINFNIGDILVIARPDLILKEKSSGRNILFDYKSSAPFRKDSRTKKEIVDTKKLKGYYKQMYVYTYALRNFKDISIDEVTLWFTRPDRKVNYPFDLKAETEAIEWFTETIKLIKLDEQFPYNNENSYFCNQLCSVRDFCEYKKRG